MARILDTILSVDKGRKQFKSATGGISNEGDGIIGISVSVPKVPGTSIYGEIDTKDISASRAGIKGGEGGDESISIGSGGLSIESSTSLGIGGNTSVSINVGSGGDVSASANTGISTPFGDFDIDVDVVKNGCTISVSRNFYSPIKSFTSTETYTAPGCKPKQPSPSPTGGQSPNLPPMGCRQELIYAYHHMTERTWYPVDSRYPGSPSIISEVSIGFFSGLGFDVSIAINGNGTGYTITSQGINYPLSVYTMRTGFGGNSSQPVPAPATYKWSSTLFVLVVINNGANGFRSGFSMYDAFGEYWKDFNHPYATQVLEGRYICNTGVPLPSPSPTPKPNWNLPPMAQDKCCRETASMLRKIMKVLAVEDIEKNGIKIPKEFLAPGGTGQLKVSNYAELQLNLFRTVNRYGIDTPIRVKIKDVNKAKKGDQSVDVQFNSPAAAIQALVELAIENKGDAATRLQIQVRLIYAVTRTLKMVAGIGETVREIIKMLGSPFKWTTTRLPLEFDLSAGLTNQSKSGEGFGDKKKQPPKNESEDGLAPGLEVNDEDTTESLLPAILTPSDYPLPVPRFVETEDDLQDLLVKAILLLGSKK
ncbi:hypothetical protein [Kamptonema formosum]|uniref:hypothetical protein n=1 Tax=Kamptonema formosum TaxID=331992 RepID=UPI000344BFA9|nr:hypothetical protein [Kamptonema formosum]